MGQAERNQSQRKQTMLVKLRSYGQVSEPPWSESGSNLRFSAPSVTSQGCSGGRRRRPLWGDRAERGVARGSEEAVGAVGVGTTGASWKTGSTQLMPAEQLPSAGSQVPASRLLSL